MPMLRPREVKTRSFIAGKDAAVKTCIWVSAGLEKKAVKVIPCQRCIRALILGPNPIIIENSSNPILSSLEQSGDMVKPTISFPIYHKITFVSLFPIYLFLVEDIIVLNPEFLFKFHQVDTVVLLKSSLDAYQSRLKFCFFIYDIAKHISLPCFHLLPKVINIPSKVPVEVIPACNKEPFEIPMSLPSSFTSKDISTPGLVLLKAYIYQE